MAGCGGEGEIEVIEDLPPLFARSNDIHIFYYAWYGNPGTDGEYRHWDHEVISPGGEVIGRYPGGDDIGASFYPRAGCYSSNDPETVRRHMSQIRLTGCGVVCVSWWGRGSFSDRAVPLILDQAARHGLRVNFHIEPFEGRNAEAVAGAIEYIVGRYGRHQAFYRADRFGGLPMFYVYDSYLIPRDDWAGILTPSGGRSIRKTPHDALVIGLLVDEDDGTDLLASGFDGLYTYFAADGFTWGSSAINWDTISHWAWDHDMIFVPCVGPGYDDTRIRPWNVRNRRLRDGGEYMKGIFALGLRASTPFIGITSFNEWHEGTQIEPAVPKKIEDFEYSDYSPMPPDFYLHKTRSLVQNLKYSLER